LGWTNLLIFLQNGDDFIHATEVFRVSQELGTGTGQIDFDFTHYLSRSGRQDYNAISHVNGFLNVVTNHNKRVSGQTGVTPDLQH
jgi:hypothetical protein